MVFRAEKQIEGMISKRIQRENVVSFHAVHDVNIRVLLKEVGYTTYNHYVDLRIRQGASQIPEQRRKQYGIPQFLLGKYDDGV